MKDPLIRFVETPCPNPVLQGPCHTVATASNGDGYCQIKINGKKALCHRFTYARDVAPIPPGLVCDHLCRNRRCCNPLHIRLVSRKTNNTENFNRPAPKSHCDHGHPFDQANILRDKHGYRKCRACKNQRRRKPQPPG